MSQDKTAGEKEVDLDKVSSQPLHRKLWSMNATTRLSHLEAEGQTFLPSYL